MGKITQIPNGPLISSEIGQHVAQSCTAHVATQRGCAARPPPRHPPHAQPVALLRSCHDGRPRLTPRGGPDQAPLHEQGYPGRRTREEQPPQRCTCLVRRCPPASPLFASSSWPRHTWMLVGTYCSDSIGAEFCTF